MTIEITTRIGCPNYCEYCPQDVLLGKYEGSRQMTAKTFKRILFHTPREVQIDFAGFCEPFLNPWASWMMYHAIKEGYSVVLDTTFTRFTDRDLEILTGLHFKQVFVHVYPGADDTIHWNTERLKRVITADKFEVSELPSNYRLSRAGNLWDRPVEKGRFGCGWDENFTRNIVLPNGDVYLCCMDYGLKHKLGNMIIQHYNSLDRKKIFDLADQDNSDIICRKCEIFKKI